MSPMPTNRDTDALHRSDASARELGWIAGYTPREFAGLATFYLMTLGIGALLFDALVHVWRAM